MPQAWPEYGAAVIGAVRDRLRTPRNEESTQRFGDLADAAAPRAAETVAVSDRHNRLDSDLRSLEQTAKAGESEDTPWILLGGEWLFWAAVTAVVLLLALAGYWLAS